MRLSTVLLSVFLVTGLQASPFFIDLVSIRTEGDTLPRLGVQVGIGGGEARIYMFDTGSSGFVSAKNSAWIPNGSYTLVLPDTETTPIVYGSGLELELETVATQIQFYDRTGTHVVYDTNTLPDSAFNVGLVTEAKASEPGSQSLADQWNDNQHAGLPVLESTFYGLLGADLASTQSSNQLYAIIPQLANGFIVQAGGQHLNNPRVQVGLTSEDKASFDILLPMLEGSGDFFPNSDNPTWAQFLLDVGYTIRNDGGQYEITLPTVFDTGAPDINFELDSSNLNLLEPLLQTDYSFAAGTEIEANFLGGSLFSDYLWAFLTGSELPSLAGATLSHGNQVNLGLYPFHNFDVLYDVENGIVGLRAVVIPENSTYALFAGLFVMIGVLLRQRILPPRRK
jgi:hypothetical protein